MGTLTGAAGTYLRVGDETERELQNEKALCFQDSFLHSIEHRRDGAERISLVIRVMHPDARKDMYGDAPRTDAQDLNGWNAEDVLKDEVERMRAAYRKLADVSAEGSSAPSGCTGNLAAPDSARGNLAAPE